MPALPARSLGVYWPCWSGPVLSSIPTAYNTIYLFAATPVGGQPGSTGAVEWSQSVENVTQFKADVAAKRAAGTCVILSVGGANSYIQLDTAARSQSFTASIMTLYTQLGGFDGLDFDIEGGTVWPAQLTYIARALKGAYGPAFAITYPPAPWSSADRAVCAALHAAGVLDLCSPQYYDLTGLTSEASKISNMVSSIETSWLPQVSGDASKLGLGYGISSAVSETMTLASLTTAWNTLVAKYPALRGAFAWESHADAAGSWAFETTMAPLLHIQPPPPPPPPPPSYTVKAGDTWAGIATANNLTLAALMQANPPVPGQIITL